MTAKWSDPDGVDVQQKSRLQINQLQVLCSLEACGESSDSPKVGPSSYNQESKARANFKQGALSTEVTDLSKEGLHRAILAIEGVLTVQID